MGTSSSSLVKKNNDDCKRNYFSSNRHNAATEIIKGHHAHKKEGRLFMLDDFCKEYFSGEWHRCYDRLGDGCEVDFPIRITSKLRWSTAVYDENCVHKPKCYTEILNVAVLKKRI